MNPKYHLLYRFKLPNNLSYEIRADNEAKVCGAFSFGFEWLFKEKLSKLMVFIGR